MSQILSQDEVDALLNGVAGGAVKPEEPGDDSGARAYDLTSQKRIIRGRMPGMDIINEKYVRGVKTSLSNTLRKPIDLLATNMEVVRYGDFLNTLQVPTNLNIFTMEPLDGYGILVLEANLVFALVNCLFGGASGFHSKVEGREFTQIEQRLIHNTVKTLLKEYEQAWKQVHPLGLKYVRSEINPRSAAVAAPGETLIKHQFDLELDGMVSKMFICLPYSSLEPISEKLYNCLFDNQGGAGRWRSYFENKLMESYANVTVELGSVVINVVDLLGLQVGDVIQLHKRVEDPLDVKVEGVPKLMGSPGTMNSNQAVKIRGFHKRGIE